MTFIVEASNCRDVSTATTRSNVMTAGRPLLPAVWLASIGRLLIY
jgi:hypothetical protein